MLELLQYFISQVASFRKCRLCLHCTDFFIEMLETLFLVSKFQIIFSPVKYQLFHLSSELFNRVWAFHTVSSMHICLNNTGFIWCQKNSKSSALFSLSSISSISLCVSFFFVEALFQVAALSTFKLKFSFRQYIHSSQYRMQSSGYNYLVEYYREAGTFDATRLWTEELN